LEDERIIELYFERSEDAIKETKIKYNSYCTKIAYNILASFEDTEECVSDTYMHTWNAIPPSKPNDLKAFIGRITRNLSLNRLKANSAKKRGEIALILDELQISSLETPYDEVEKKMVADSITRFLQTLAPVKQQIFVLRYWYFESISAISQKTGWKKASIKSELYRLRSKLKSHLEKEGFYDET
jgi:RNA polymerase sigma-70 factor (ECF subfamily)